jgi:hypothetical protein
MSFSEIGTYRSMIDEKIVAYIEITQDKTKEQNMKNNNVDDNKSDITKIDSSKPMTPEQASEAIRRAGVMKPVPELDPYFASYIPFVPHKTSSGPKQS